jgi:hypothetical protein
LLRGWTGLRCDFDLAIRDLEKAGWVKTGPLEAYQNRPGAAVVLVGLFSKREYTYLSVEGYKAATRVKSVRMPPAQHVHISGSFNQSPIGVGNHIAQTIQVSAADAAVFQQLREEIESKIDDRQKRSEILARLDALEEAQDKPSRIERYTQLVSSMLGDHITVLTSLAPLMHRKGPSTMSRQNYYVNGEATAESVGIAWQMALQLLATTSVRELWVIAQTKAQLMSQLALTGLRMNCNSSAPVWSRLGERAKIILYQPGPSVARLR